MPAALSTLFGAAFTVVTALSVGLLLFRRLLLKLDRSDYWLLAFLTGSAVLSEFIFLLASFHLARTWIFLVIGAVAVLLAWRTGAFHVKPKSAFPAVGRVPKAVFLALAGAFTFIYFFNAMAPEMSPDGATYHLGIVLRYFRAHGFQKITTNIYANLSQGLELLFLFAFSFGRNSAAALTHFAFLICATLLITAYGRRIGYPTAGAAASIFFYAAPVVGMDGSIAYNDIALAAVLFGLFYLLQVWDQQRDPHLLIPIGILAGWCYAIKYTAFLAVPYALGFVLWKLWRARKPALRPLLVLASLTAVFVLPWMLKNWMWLANPASPFANRLFPNPYVHVSFETEYSQFMRQYTLTSYREIPLQLTVKGDALAGFFGPLFLLTPLGLLALRFRAGRQLWLAAVIFALPYAANIGARFLIPAAPFVALALALAFANLSWLLVALAIGHAVTCWPYGMDKFFGTNAWRLRSIPWEAALRLVPQEQYLAQHLPEYDIALLIQRVVPPGGKVFSFSTVAEAYTDRTILMRYEAALNERLGDMLWAAVTDAWQPSILERFQFQPRTAGRIRVLETAKATVSQWSVNELRVFQQGRELPRGPQWRLAAHPDPWDVQLAFDNNPATRWRTWQLAEPGMFLQVDFGQPQTIDAVDIETSPDSQEAKLQLESMETSGKWSVISAAPAETSVPIRINLRKAATEEMKVLGIRYILVRKDDPHADDFVHFSSLWGLTVAGVVGDATLLYVQ